MAKTNYQLIKEIETKLKDKETIYEIIFLNTLIGSYNARENYFKDTERNPQDFNIGRITTRIYEAEKIAEEIENTLKLFKKRYKPETILKRLYSEILKIKDENIPKEGLYKYLTYLKNKNQIHKAGKRLEIKLMNGKQIITENTLEQEIKKSFLKESSIMSDALVYEIEDLPNNHQY